MANGVVTWFHEYNFVGIRAGISARGMEQVVQAMGQVINDGSFFSSSFWPRCAACGILVP